nr:tetraacyldisaccharide 4'-kinase [Desulfobacteraceae bacterium]
LSWIYGLAVRLRSILYDKGIFKSHRLPCRVISVGNITVGGTGKTPVTMHVARLLRDAGYRIAVISRGYKGRAEKSGGIVSNSEAVLMTPEDAGDEPFMMAAGLKGVPVLVGRNRVAVGRVAVEAFHPDVIILDDGFQHRGLFRDMDIVLIDDASFSENMHFLPRGPLREPVSALKRADVMVLTRSSNPLTPALDILARLAPGKPVFQSIHAPYVCGVIKAGGTPSGSGRAPAFGIFRDVEWLKHAKVFVFSGIAKNQAFRDMVAGMAGAVAGEMAFPDHHPYTAADMHSIAAQAKTKSADFLVTTEKDYVKVHGRLRSPMDIVIIGIEASFDVQGMAFAGFIKDMLAAKLS